MYWPPSTLVAKCHPLVDEIEKRVDKYFLARWGFPDEKSRQKYLLSGFARGTCMCFPLSKDDRMELACRFLTALFLIDDELEHMSFEAGAAYCDKLMLVARAKAEPDRNVPAEVVFSEVWPALRERDRTMADGMLDPTYELMRAQTDKIRLTKMGLGEYLEYRERDIGKAILSALMRFGMALQLTPAEQKLVAEAESTCSRQLTALNDVWSFEKEVLAAETLDREGGVLCNSVTILAYDAGVSIPSSKRILAHLCREYELRHAQHAEDVLRAAARSGSGADPEKLRLYLEGLACQMAGNEAWSKITHRYISNAN